MSSISTEHVTGFIAEFRNGYFSPTLTTLFGDLLNKAEERYGERDKNWTPLGIEFVKGIPEIWRMGIEKKKYFCIRLSHHTANDPALAIYDLAHETIHALGPVLKEETKVIEEGLATMFADEASPSVGGIVRNALGNYGPARDLVKEFVAIAGPEGVKNLRKCRPSISHVTADLIREKCRAVSVSMANSLCERFKYT
jgi:hypothetical protein